jgi:hypothetical protein
MCQEPTKALLSAEIPKPSDAVTVKLAEIAAQVEEVLAIDRPVDKAPVGMRNLKNDRRRAVEKVLVLLADPDVRSFLAKMRAT